MQKKNSNKKPREVQVTVELSSRTVEKMNEISKIKKTTFDKMAAIAVTEYLSENS